MTQLEETLAIVKSWKDDFDDPVSGETLICDRGELLTVARALIELAEAVEKAPHERKCASHQETQGIWREIYYTPTDKPCNCFKSALGVKP